MEAPLESLSGTPDDDRLGSYKSTSQLTDVPAPKTSTAGHRIIASTTTFLHRLKITSWRLENVFVNLL
ncbi:hypothetical protein L1987_02698 [Smallanthus sonchifolius]|uniref:Uncharacterized protein n=1 Tax=Smallanthus sonchifolius TaxID=185202 RepID=A0ACB9K8Q1_9ASTR|nr:hypothetical protein L1987_02698 [Smallanthus sonchifolius]